MIASYDLFPSTLSARSRNGNLPKQKYIYWGKKEEEAQGRYIKWKYTGTYMCSLVGNNWYMGHKSLLFPFSPPFWRGMGCRFSFDAELIKTRDTYTKPWEMRWTSLLPIAKGKSSIKLFTGLAYQESVLPFSYMQADTSLKAGSVTFRR